MTGLILQHFCHCKIVGFCNSSNKIWLIKDAKINSSNVAFIDMFVANPNVVCIDQHLVAYNLNHNDILIANHNKFNPNILRKRCFFPKDSYYKKYPFGTVHYVIAELEKSQIDLSSIQLFSKEKQIQPIDFFLRADDTMNTTKFKYYENAKDWWNWLKSYSNHGKITNQFIDYLYSDINAKKIKKSVENQLKSPPYECEKPDGGYSEILNQKNQLLPNFIAYINYMADSINLPRLNLEPNFFKTITGIAKRVNFNTKQAQEFCKDGIISQQKIFSYAFVKSFGMPNSMIYTYFEKTKS